MRFFRSVISFISEFFWRQCGLLSKFFDLLSLFLKHGALPSSISVLLFKYRSVYWYLVLETLHCISKPVTALSLYNFSVGLRQPILIAVGRYLIFGTQRIVFSKVLKYDQACKYLLQKLEILYPTRWCGVHTPWHCVYEATVTRGTDMHCRRCKWADAWSKMARATKTRRNWTSWWDSGVGWLMRRGGRCGRRWDVAGEMRGREWMGRRQLLKRVSRAARWWRRHCDLRRDTAPRTCLTELASPRATIDRLTGADRLRCTMRLLRRSTPVINLATYARFCVSSLVLQQICKISFTTFTLFARKCR